MKTSMEVMFMELETRKRKSSSVLWSYEYDSRGNTLQEEGK